MSAENVELVRAAFNAWNVEGPAALMDRAVDDVVWLEVSGWLESQGQEVRGREVLLANLHTLFDAWDTYRLELEEIHDAGERVVAIVRERGRGRASGVGLDSLWGYVITVADGKLARIEAYRDPEAALAAADLG
jgi:ketosteroid isomerase-like protein